ncbi:vitamin B12-dependent ribonucleotide reductase [Candidatus Woesearchaeota archaeon]|nr:vitamin B12-dependent ribonucleotide reductase [Candidatus Woesearchaeota archaeon]
MAKEGTRISKIRKRDGRIVPFEKEKVINAIFKAAQAVGGKDREEAARMAGIVVEKLEEQFGAKKIPTVEEIQDIVEKVMIQEGHASTAKAFILYRQKRADIRRQKTAIIGMGKEIETNLSPNALKVLKERYLLRDLQGNIIETPDGLFRRIAKNVAKADKLYDEKVDLNEVEEKFYEMIASLDFLPNSPTLMNAGTKLQQLSACFVLPIEDSMESIFGSLKDTALIHKSGGGTGFSFSKLRAKNSVVASTKGVASGPISFMKVFDAATEIIKQGGKRRGANMGVLRVDHPDILDFITCKDRADQITNFNISVALTDEFMQKVKKNEDYDLINPSNGKVEGKLNAGDVFDLIVSNAWKNGEPGIIFIDRMNRDNPTPKVGVIESTNPCGEQPLLPYESCNLGSINLANFVKDKKIDYERLKKLIWDAVHFLDNVIDMNKYPVPEIEKMTKANRKIGLGVMGFADMLYQLESPYNSSKGIKIAEEVMKFINEEAKKDSVELAKKRGVFPNFKGSIYDNGKKEDRVRNATRTTIAPTGTLSMISDVSSGVEPNFAISYIKRVMDGKELLYINKIFEKTAKEKGFYSEELMQKTANKGSIARMEEIPEDVRKVFVVAHDITPKWHAKMQAAFQRHTNNAVSKTVNFPSDATMRDVEDVYKLCHEEGCKGVTIYRDKSREAQVLNLEIPQKKMEEAIEEKSAKKPKDICPKCGSKMVAQEGCFNCPKCSFSVCKV